MAKSYDFKKSIPESTVLHSCLQTLKYLGIYAWRNNTGAVRTPKGGFVQFGLKGSSDILGITHDGKLLAIECKRPVGGVLSADQKKFIDAVNSYGGVAIVATSEVEMVEKLKERGVL